MILAFTATEILALLFLSSQPHKVVALLNVFSAYPFSIQFGIDDPAAKDDVASHYAARDQNWFDQAIKQAGKLTTMTCLLMRPSAYNCSSSCSSIVSLEFRVPSLS